MDTGILQFGDLDWLWTEKIQKATSAIEFAGFKMGSNQDTTIVNFWMMCQADNPLILRAHDILLKLWDCRTHTAGMHNDALVAHVSLLKVPENLKLKTEDAIDDGMMTDYAIQIQALGAAMRWVDPSDGWHGPNYVKQQCWLYDMVEHAYINENLTNWDSAKQAEIFATPLPSPGSEKESQAQELGRRIVTQCFTEGWVLKLAHGFSAKLFGAPTLGMLWRDTPGSDCIEGTHGGWLRWAMMNLKPDQPLQI